MLEASERIFALLQGKHKTSGILVSWTEVLHVAEHKSSWWSCLRYKQKVLALQFVLAWRPQDRIFSVILRKLCRKISILFSPKPFSPRLYLYHEDVIPVFSQLLSSILDLGV